jgi:SAM-dependent methyltransferase
MAEFTGTRQHYGILQRKVIMSKQDKIRWIYTSSDNQELNERYNQWAKDYDYDLTQNQPSRGPELSVSFFASYVTKEKRILDAAAGTGIVGKMLTEQGYKDLVAMDLSEGMLEEARRKNVYRELHRMVMGEPLDFATDSFDATICVGAFTPGHAPPSSFDELIRITRYGGYIVFTLNTETYENSGFKEKLITLESKGMWKLVKESEKLQLITSEPDITHQIWVYQVTS